MVVGILARRWGRREILLQSSRQQGTTHRQHQPIQGLLPKYSMKCLQPNQAYIQVDITDKSRKQICSRSAEEHASRGGHSSKHREHRQIDGLVWQAGASDKGMLQLGAANPPSQPTPAAQQTGMVPLRESAINPASAGRGWGYS